MKSEPVVVENDSEKTDTEKTDTEKTVTEPKYTPEELLVIFDEILFSGEYREDVLIKNKLKVTFRSRTASETTSISKDLDSKAFNLLATLQQERSFLHIVHSLVTYSGKDVGVMPLDKRKEFVGALPAVIVAALSDALVIFDEKTSLACIEGEQNF